MAAMVYFNASIQDWWGSAGYGGRRFDGTLPLFVLGAAAAIDGLGALLARRPRLAAAVVLVRTRDLERDVPGSRRLGQVPVGARVLVRRDRGGAGARPAPMDRAPILLAGQPVVRGARTACRRPTTTCR